LKIQAGKIPREKHSGFKKLVFIEILLGEVISGDDQVDKSSPEYFSTRFFSAG
jgi:hypothetical protein